MTNLGIQDASVTVRPSQPRARLRRDIPEPSYQLDQLGALGATIHSLHAWTYHVAGSLASPINWYIMHRFTAAGTPGARPALD